jgi:hypothetical protein
MKSLLLALAAVSFAVIATFAALNALQVQKEIAGSAAGVFLGALPYVHKRFERYAKTPIPALKRDAVVTFDSFALPDLVLFVYATFVAIAASQLIGGFSLAITEGAAAFDNMAAPVAGLLSAPLQLFTAFVIGRWVGVRSGRRGVLIVVTAFGVSISAEHVLRLVFMSDTEFAATFGVDRTVVIVLAQWGGGIVLWTLLALFGFWRGRKRRLSQYADYLLRKLPPETRDTVLLLLREEVARLSVTQSPAPVTAPVAAPAS